MEMKKIKEWNKALERWNLLLLDKYLKVSLFAFKSTAYIKMVGSKKDFARMNCESMKMQSKGYFL